VKLKMAKLVPGVENGLVGYFKKGQVGAVVLFAIKFQKYHQLNFLATVY